MIAPQGLPIGIVTQVGAALQPSAIAYAHDIPAPQAAHPVLPASLDAASWAGGASVPTSFTNASGAASMGEAASLVTTASGGDDASFAPASLGTKASSLAASIADVALLHAATAEVRAKARPNAKRDRMIER